MRSDNTTINQDGASSSLQRIRPLHGRNSGPTRRSTKGQWTPEEDQMLYKAVQQFQGKNWKKIAECFKDRSDVQCLHRWQKVLNPELIKGPWSKEEDERIVELVNKYGPKKWSTIAQHLPGRIGKQCRERWHNHLNPGINKEAWSQEEELTLIRAHQIYGNKWAELTKFFPGRSDNAIKNHWNSSVKKKLDSYLASGLLAQFQGPSYVGQQTSSTPSSSLRIQQSSGEESVPKDGAEAEEISECSQGSGAVGCSQSGSEKANGVLHVREECQTMEESCQGKEQNSNTALCSGKYYASIEEINYCVPDIQCKQGGSPKLFAQSISHHDGTSMSRLCQYNLHELPNSSLPTHFIDPHEKHEVIPGVLQNSLGLSSSTSVGIPIMGSEKPEGVLTPKGNTSRIGFAEAGPGACFSSESLIKCSNIVDLIDCTDSVPYESSNFQKPETARTSVSQLFYPLKWSDMSGSSCCESFLSSSSILPVDDDTILNSAEPNQLNDLSVGNLKQEIVGKSLDGFLCPNGSADSTFNDGTDAAGLQDLVDSSSKLVHEDIFQLVSSDVMDGHCIDEKPAICAEQGDAGGLCYEPPRFPSVDIPFFSCDLIQSGSEMQYSPLGIRQLMTSSVNCMTPFRLWDSPSKDDGPDAMLKSAAKTYTCTPSILKKRQRDLLSPLSEKRFDKKLASNFSQEFSTSSLARDFSRLDVMFKETESPKASPCSPSYNENKKLEPHSEDKENICPEMGKEEKRDGTGKVNADADAQVEQSYGAFIECNLNDLLFFSPVQVGLKPERVLGSSAASSRRHGKESQVASNQITFPQSSARNQCLSDISSPTVYKKKHDNHPTAVPPRNYAPSTDPDVTAENKRNIAGIENFNMFGETPFKRSLESPSAWKSPWFFNSFFPRVNGELSIEDFGYFMSPGDRSYDAIGLMKQLNEHTAATFANAQAILGNETPETILKERLSNHQNTEQENNHAANGDLKNSPPFSSNILGERRILDFSDCDSPAKETENGKGSAAISFSSPSSYLLKGCR